MIGIISKPSFYLGPVGPRACNGNAWDFEVLLQSIQAKQRNSMIDGIFGVERRVKDGF